MPAKAYFKNLREDFIAQVSDIIDQIIEKGAISDANLRLLVDSIVISEQNKKLHIKINLNAKFERHKDYYDAKRNLVDRIFL